MKKTKKNDHSGQAVIEYILMMAIVVGFYSAVVAIFNRYKVADVILKTIIGPFSAAYRYGHTQAKGYDDGGPTNHPRASGGENNFRLFLNPDGK